jgi:hypothetical protein
MLLNLFTFCIYLFFKTYVGGFFVLFLSCKSFVLFCFVVQVFMWFPLGVVILTCTISNCNHYLILKKFGL